MMNNKIKGYSPTFNRADWNLSGILSGGYPLSLSEEFCSFCCTKLSKGKRMKYAESFAAIFYMNFSICPFNKFKWLRNNLQVFDLYYLELKKICDKKIVPDFVFDEKLVSDILKEIKRKNSYPFRRSRADAFISKSEVRKFVFNRDNNKCVRCPATENLTVDHIISVYNNGSNEYTNLQTLCKPCNSKKNYN